jgi:AI-2 transport protein TqsA
VTFALFVIAIVWPVQQALQARIPKLLALLVTILGVLLVISVLGFLLIWGFSRVIQWFTSNAGRLQALYVQATEWLDGHGISIADMVNTNWLLPAVKDLGGRGYRLISFVVIAFAFTVLGPLEVDIVRKNIKRLKDAATGEMLLLAGTDIASAMKLVKV